MMQPMARPEGYRASQRKLAEIRRSVFVFFVLLALAAGYLWMIGW